MIRCPGCGAANAPPASACHLCERSIVRVAGARLESVELSSIAEDTARRGRSYGLLLDFSAASVATLDVWLDGIWPTEGIVREGPTFRPDREQVELVWSLGVYLGEVFVRLLAGMFREDRARAGSPPDVPVVFRGDVAAWPVARARERLRAGTVKALYPYFRFVRTQVAGREDAPGDAAGWLAHAQAFALQRSYDHALRFSEHALSILPGSVPALLEKAAAEYALGHDADARVTFDRLVETAEAVGARDWLHKARARLPDLAAPRMRSLIPSAFPPPTAPSATPPRPTAPPPRPALSPSAPASTAPSASSASIAPIAPIASSASSALPPKKKPPRPPPRRPASPSGVATHAPELAAALAAPESSRDAPGDPSEPATVGVPMHPSLAAEEIAAKLGFGGELELANLEAVDRWIEALGGLDDDASERVAYWVGAYVGEILVRRLGGTWHFDPAEPLEASVEFDGVGVVPVRWVAHALRDGRPLAARAQRLAALLA
jgi:tetratricopeptide (TPR) repeat protein